MASLNTMEDLDHLLSVFKNGYRYNGCHYVGLKKFDRSAPDMYQNMWHWLDGTVALYVNMSALNGYIDRGKLEFGSTLYPLARNARKCIGYICESLAFNQKNVSRKGIHVARLISTDDTRTTQSLSLVKCPEGHVTRDFLLCEPRSNCGLNHPVSMCPLPSDVDRWSVHFAENLAAIPAQAIQMMPKYVPMFECDQGRVRIAYSLVCDFKEECSDRSDEHFCQHITCPHKRCTNGQCMSGKKWCDGVRHCYDNSDEVKLWLLQIVYKHI